MITPPPSSRRRNVVLRSLLVVGVLAIVVVVGFRWWRSHAIDVALARFEAVTAPLIARGEPLGVFDREAAEADDDNGAPALLEAIEALRYEVGESNSWPAGPWGLLGESPEDLSPDELAGLSAFVDGRAAFYASVDAAASAEVLVFAARSDADGMLEWAPIPLLTDVAGLLRARALAGRDEAERATALATLARLGRRWRARSALEAMVATVFVTTAAREARELLARGRVSSAALAPLDALLTDDLIHRFPELVRAERAWQLSLHDALVDLPGVDDRATESMLQRAGFDRAQVGISLAGPEVVDSAADLVVLDEALLALPTEDHVALSVAVERLTGPVREADESWLPWVRVRQMVGRGGAAMMARFVTSLTSADAQLRMTRLAIAAAAHRESSGAWPESLDVLGPSFAGSVPVDPRTGGPFGYEVRDDGTVRIASRDDESLDWAAPR